MDERLRKLSREDDPLALAQAALRTGDASEARRIARSAHEGGEERAAEVLAWLEAHLPLPELLEQELDLLAQLLPSTSWRTLLPIRLLSACDLRCDEALRTWLARGVGEGAPAIGELLALRGAERWESALVRFGPQALVYAEPTAREVLVLVQRARELEGPLSLPLELSLLYLLATRRSDPSVRRLLEAWTPRALLSVAELQLAVFGRKGAHLATVAGTELPWRPAWVPQLSPLQVRDSQSLSLHRRLLQGGRVARAFADSPALLLVDVDGMHEFNQEHGHAEGDLALTRIAESLRELVGDRAVRTSGDEWLVAWEGEAPAGRARALVAAQVGEGPPTISVALDQRPGPLEERLRRLELAILPREGPRAAQVILVE